MKKYYFIRFISFLIVLILTQTLFVTQGAFAAQKNTLDDAINLTAEYLLKNVKDPAFGAVGGEWLIFGLARSDYKVPDYYFNTYFKDIEKTIKERKGVLHERKYTEYSRVVLSLTALGYDPSKIMGYDLVLPLINFEKTIMQGLNGSIWALIALDSAQYGKTDIREKYILEILKRQLADGGWNMLASNSEKNISSSVDITAMALQALAKYQKKSEVKTAVDKAIKFLSQASVTDSCGLSQIIVALYELGFTIDDALFLKNNKTLLDRLLDFQNPNGSFSYNEDGRSNQMATEQAFYSLVAIKRIRNGKSSLYQAVIPKENLKNELSF